MARKRRWLLWSFLVVILLLAGIVLWAWNTDLGRFKPQLETFVSDTLGRSFQLAELHLHLGETIEISSNGLRLANPEWAEQPDLLRVGRIEASIPLRSLFNPPIIVDRLVITDVTVDAEFDAEAGHSWQFEMTTPTETGTPAEKSAGLPLWIKRIQLDSLNARIERPGELPPLNVEVDTLTQDHRADDQLELTLIGRVNGQPVEFLGELGTLSAILEDREVSIKGDARAGPITIEGEALVDSLAAPRRPTFDLLISGRDLSEVAAMLQLPQPPAVPFEVTGRGRPDDSGLDVTLKATAGDLRVDLEGRSESLVEFSVIDYRLSAEGENLGAITRFLGLGAWPEDPFSIAGSVRRDGPLLELEDVRFDIGLANFVLDGELKNFPDLNNARLALQLTGDDAARFRELLGIRGAAEGPFSADGSIQARPDGRDDVSFNLRTEVLETKFEGTLGTEPGYVGTIGEIAINGRDAKVLFDALDIPGFTREPFSLESEFEVVANGVSLKRGVLASLGEDRIEVEGLVSLQPLEKDTNVRIRARGDDLAQLASLAGAEVPIATQPYELDLGFRATPEGFRIDGLQGRVGPNDIDFDGLVTRNPGLSGSDFTFGLKGPDLETLLRDTAGWDVPAQDFSVSGHLRQLGNSVRLDDLALSIGALKGNASLELPKPFDGSEFRLGFEVTGPDINTIAPEVAGLTLATNAFESTGLITRKGNQWGFEQTRVVLGDAKLDVNGVVTLGGDLGHGDLQLALAIPDLKGLGTYNGVPREGFPLSAEFRLAGSPEQVRLEPLSAQLGPTDLQGHLAYSTAEEVPFIEFVTRSRRIDLPDLQRRLVGEKPTEEKTDQEQPGDGRVIPDFDFPLEQLRSLNAAIDVAAAEFPGKLDMSRNLELKGSLRDGALRIENLHVDGFEGSITANGSLVPDDRGSADLQLNLGLDGLVLELSLDEEVDPNTLPTVNLDAALSGNGPDLRAWAASLDGHIRADSGPGVIPNSALAFFDAGLLEQIFTNILPVPKQPTDTQLKCFATRLAIEDGVVRAAPGVAIVTDKVQMISKGEIDLRTEGLSLDFETQPTKAYKANISEVLVNPFVKISGTLGAPAVTLDTPKAALAIGTAGISILARALLNRMMNSSDPCGEFMKSQD